MTSQILKIKLVLIISILSCSIFAQDLIELEEQKSKLINRGLSLEILLENKLKENDSILASIDRAIM
jgi:hypothetical protein